MKKFHYITNYVLFVLYIANLSFDELTVLMQQCMSAVV